MQSQRSIRFDRSKSFLGRHVQTNADLIPELERIMTKVKKHKLRNDKYN